MYSTLDFVSVFQPSTKIFFEGLCLPLHYVLVDRIMNLIYISSVSAPYITYLSGSPCFHYGSILSMWL
jgi:hypothetical protein